MSAATSPMADMLRAVADIRAECGQPSIAAHLNAAADTMDDLYGALSAILGPLAVCSDNANVADDTSLPVDLTMGELRRARAALAKAGRPA